MKGITDYLEKEQVDQILGAAKTCSIRDYLMLRILWRAGCRVSELLSITASDIELKNQIVNITKAKGGKQRKVLLYEETLALPFEYISSSNIPPDDRPIFGIKRCHVHTLSRNTAR